MYTEAQIYRRRSTYFVDELFASAARHTLSLTLNSMNGFVAAPTKTHERTRDGENQKQDHCAQQFLFVQMDTLL